MGYIMNSMDTKMANKIFVLYKMRYQWQEYYYTTDTMCSVVQSATLVDGQFKIPKPCFRNF